MESFYFAFRDADVYVIADLPDNAAAMAMVAAVMTTGALSSYETVVLLTPDEVDRTLSCPSTTRLPVPRPFDDARFRPHS